MSAKPSWKKVHEIHAEYMRVLIVCMVNRFKPQRSANTDTILCGEVDDGTTKASVNLLEEDEVIELSAQAFRKAYKAWDGIRDFRPFYRKVFITDVNYLVRKKRLYRHRFPNTLDLAFTLEHGTVINGVDLAQDQLTYAYPAEVADLMDFIETMPEASRTLVQAVLNAPVVLGVSLSAGIKEIAYALWPYANSKLGWTRRQYWKAFKQTGDLIRERANGKDALRSISSRTRNTGYSA